MNRHLVVAGLAATLLVGVAAPAGAVAPAFVGNGTIADCRAEFGDVQSNGCYEMKVLPNAKGVAQVGIDWYLWDNAEGFNNADWKGGLWMQRWPIEGQGRKVVDPVQTFPDGLPHEECSGDKIGPSNCYKTFAGGEGSMTLSFPAAMAGYVYEIYSHDYICSVDQSGCGPSGGAVGGNTYPYVFVHKAFRWKDTKGRWQVTRGCPAEKKRSSKCANASIAELARSIGGGDTVSPPD